MHAKPTDAELEILHVLWARGACTVRQVNEALNATLAQEERRNSGEVGYTTTLKIMQIMAEKGLLARDERERTHIYKAAIAEDDVQKAAIGKLVDSVFRGSAMNLAMRALGARKLSRDELTQIRALLDEELKRENGDKTDEIE
jgi:predicted transcriptional regulator